MQFNIYLIGHPLPRAVLGDAHAEAFSAAGLPISYERLDIPPVNFHSEITTLTRDRRFLGAKIGAPYKQSTLAYCQELSPTAQVISAVNTLARRPSGLVYGHNTDVLAFVRCLAEQGLERVRTALILGAGGAARVALAGLRELSCARYMVGYRNPRRPTELSSQFKGIRRQISYFPLEEMTAFFGWAEETKVFGARAPMPAPGEEINNGRKEDDNVKRWDLLVNATPVGQTPQREHSLVNSVNFLRCFDRVLDMVPQQETTRLEQLAAEARVPLIRGLRLFELQAEYSRELWLREYRRHSGEADEGAARRPRMVVKRRSR